MGFVEVLKLAGPEGVMLLIIYLLIKSQNKTQGEAKAELVAQFKALAKQMNDKTDALKDELDDVRASIAKIYGDALADLRERVAKLEARVGSRRSSESTADGRRS